jgi:hypothetical protein
MIADQLPEKALGMRSASVSERLCSMLEEWRYWHAFKNTKISDY